MSAWSFQSLRTCSGDGSPIDQEKRFHYLACDSEQLAEGPADIASEQSALLGAQAAGEFSVLMRQ